MLPCGYEVVLFNFKVEELLDKGLEDPSLWLSLNLASNPVVLGMSSYSII